MAKWAEIKCPRCAELEAKLNYAVGEWSDYDKTIEQLQAERLANRVAIMRFEVKLAKAVEALREVKQDCLARATFSRNGKTVPIGDGSWHMLLATLAELTGGKDE